MHPLDCIFIAIWLGWSVQWQPDTSTEPKQILQNWLDRTCCVTWCRVSDDMHPTFRLIHIRYSWLRFRLIALLEHQMSDCAMCDANQRDGHRCVAHTVSTNKTMLKKWVFQFEEIKHVPFRYIMSYWFSCLLFVLLLFNFANRIGLTFLVLLITRITISGQEYNKYLINKLNRKEKSKLKTQLEIC